MRPTPRFWNIGAVSAFLVGLGIVAQESVMALGGIGLAGWLLITQFTALGEFRQATEQLTVETSAVRNAAVVGEKLSLTTEVTLETSVRSKVEVVVTLPPGAEREGGSDISLVLQPGETATSTTYSCSFPVAGVFDLPPATVTVTNRQQTLTETVPVDLTERVRIDPRQPQNLHVGQGGERIAAYGEHPAEAGSSGLVPEEIRQYVTGDSLDQIDWKATARLQSPHVREFEAETDRKTVIAVDHSHAMGLGPEGQTMLDYVREVALGYARAAESFDDPLGLYAVGDHGITVRQRPVSSPVGYRHIRNALHDLEPTQSETASKLGATDDQLTRPGNARSAARRLATEESAFAETVAPFLGDTEAYVHRIESDPLFQATRQIIAETTGEIWLILLTTDTGRNRVRDIASLMASNGGHLSAFLTPRVLYDPGAMDDVTEAYNRYSSFESFRRAVDRNPRTDAYELGPGDRLDALLAARRRATS